MVGSNSVAIIRKQIIQFRNNLLQNQKQLKKHKRRMIKIFKKTYGKYHLSHEM